MIHVAVLVLLIASTSLADFDTSARHNVPLEDILSGGPPKDGIPAILEPRFLDATSATFLRPEDRVVGVAREGVAKAYPLRILNWHEVVNDALGRTPIAVTFCPLTASAVVFDRRMDGQTLSFGVSGQLYQSNILFYDHQTDSLWSQLREEAVTGARTGTALEAVPSVMTTWADWRAMHPETLALSTETGHRRDYRRDPYTEYHASARVMFPVTQVDERLPPKTKVFGVRVDNASRAYPLACLAELGQRDEWLGGTHVRVRYDRGAARATAVEIDSGKPVPGIEVYWFAWSAFRTDTDVWDCGFRPHVAPNRSKSAAPPGHAEDSHAVAVLNHSAYWTGLFGLGMVNHRGGSDIHESGLLVIRGEVRNTAGHDLHHVELAFELLDGRNNVVVSESGYNRGGEVLRPVDSPVPIRVERVVPVTPISRGGVDTFRMIFLRNETPPFETYRVRVLDAVAADGSPAR